MAKDYTITAQKQIREQAATGQFIDAMRIDYRTESGVTGWIVVPLNKYNVATVTEMINERVKAVNEIAGL